MTFISLLEDANISMADTLHVLILDGGVYDMKPVGFPSAAQSEAAERFPADRGGTRYRSNLRY